MKLGAAGVNVAGPIWNKFMKEALKNRQKENFTEPQKIKTGKAVLDGKIKIVERVEVCKDSGDYCVRDGGCPDGWKKDDKKFFVAHNILYYVKKDDPLENKPKEPKNDPQYERWERALKEWAEEHADGKGRDMLPDEC
jgi:membrane carboxypeptidase/penicillin-binding protein